MFNFLSGLNSLGKNHEMELPCTCPVYLKYASVGREQHIMFCVTSHHIISHNTFNQRESDTRARDSRYPPRYTSLWIYRSFLLGFPDTSDTSQQSAAINITRVDTLNGTEYPILLGWNSLSDILPKYIQLIWVFSAVYKRINGVENICNIAVVTTAHRTVNINPDL